MSIGVFALIFAAAIAPLAIKGAAHDSKPQRKIDTGAAVYRYTENMIEL